MPYTVILRSVLGLVSETLWLPEESICLLSITLLAVTATVLAAVWVTRKEGLLISA